MRYWNFETISAGLSPPGSSFKPGKTDYSSCPLPPPPDHCHRTTLWLDFITLILLAKSSQRITFSPVVAGSPAPSSLINPFKYATLFYLSPQAASYASHVYCTAFCGASLRVDDVCSSHLSLPSPSPRGSYIRQEPDPALNYFPLFGRLHHYPSQSPRCRRSALPSGIV